MIRSKVNLDDAVIVTILEQHNKIVFTYLNAIRHFSVSDKDIKDAKKELEENFTEVFSNELQDIWVNVDDISSIYYKNRLFHIRIGEKREAQLSVYKFFENFDKLIYFYQPYPSEERMGLHLEKFIGYGSLISDFYRNNLSDSQKLLCKMIMTDFDEAGYFE